MRGHDTTGALPDFRIDWNGSFSTVTALSADALAWLRANAATELWQWAGPTLAIDARFAQAIGQGMFDDGLTQEAE